jgi:Protein of unknown function (DUF1569)
MPLSPALTEPTTRDALVARILALRADAPRQWGKMNITQMLWHVAEAYRAALGDVAVRDQSNWFFRRVIRPFAFYAPFPWPKNGPTLPHFDAVRRQPPAGDPEFERLKADVVSLVQRFATWNGEGRPHPAFGPLTQSEWQHWGWRHADHHLRQFAS